MQLLLVMPTNNLLKSSVSFFYFMYQQRTYDSNTIHVYYSLFIRSCVYQRNITKGNEKEIGLRRYFFLLTSNSKLMESLFPPPPTTSSIIIYYFTFLVYSQICFICVSFPLKYEFLNSRRYMLSCSIFFSSLEWQASRFTRHKTIFFLIYSSFFSFQLTTIISLRCYDYDSDVFFLLVVVLQRNFIKSITHIIIYNLK